MRNWVCSEDESMTAQEKRKRHQPPLYTPPGAASLGSQECGVGGAICYPLTFNIGSLLCPMDFNAGTLHNA